MKRKTPRKYLDQKKKTKLERFKKGLCECGRQLAPNRKKCRKCLDKDNRLAKSRYRKMLTEGLCTCGRTLIKGQTKCEKCVDAQYLRRAKNIDNGLCRCGGELPKNRRMCDICVGYRIGGVKAAKLYRPTTEEEKEKYGDKSGNEVIREVKQYLGGYL